MKVCKFEKIKNEEEIIRIIDCIRNEHPHVVVIPTAIPLQKWLQKISASWFHHENETSHSIINTIEEYYYTLADHLITSNKLNKDINVLIQKYCNNIHNLVEGKADLLIDKIIKAEIYRLFSHLFTYCLREQGINAKLLDTSIFMQLNLERKPDIPYIQENIRPYIEQNQDTEIFIAPLSLCQNVYGEIDFVNKKYNDYYTIILATVFNANEVLLSTEINHICANLNNQREQHSLTYAEAEQLINNGAYLLYADCITLAAHSDIAIRLIDTNDTTTEKLYISSHDAKNNIKAILVQDSVTLVRFTSLNVLPDYLLMGKLLEVIGKYKIKIISMASSNVSVSMILAASRDTLRIIQRELHKYVKMTTDENMSVIHVIGSLHWKHKQIESSITETIKDIPISLIAYGSNDHCLTISVHTTDKNKVIRLLSQQFFRQFSA